MATEPTAACRRATTIEDLHEDVLTRALRLLDGSALAASSCATARLRSLSTQPHLWRDLCLTTWPSLRHPRLLRLLPSFPHSHRSFFSDAHTFPFPRATTTAAGDSRRLTELISAVDLYHDGAPIFSRVVETETTSPWFQGAPFRIDALDRKDPAAATPVISPAELTLSWVVIDPVGLRAVNLSSRRPVAVDRHWYTGETLVRFATVLEAGGWVYSAGVVVTCGEETGQVREASLTVENMDGTCLNGREALGIVGAALEGGGLEVGACEGMQHVGGDGRDQSPNAWAVLDGLDGRFGGAGGAAVQQMNQISGQPGGEMELWGYGK